MSNITSFTRLTFFNLGWVGILRACLRLAAIARTAILARILSPTDFGIFGIAVIAVALTEMITETGINVFLIQKKGEEILDKYLDTAYVISILMAIFIAVLIIVSAPLLAQFFKNPQATFIIMAIATIPLIKGFINPAIVTFQKNLLFKQEFVFRTIITLVDAVIAISTAFLIRSPYSLVLGMLAGALTEVILSHAFIKPTPKLAFKPSVAKEIIGSGKWITLMGIFGYLVNTAPDVIIGRVLSTTSLGIYQMAHRLSFLPIEEINETFNKVAFPTYAKLRHDPPRLKRAFFKTAGAMCALALPFALLVSLSAEPIISVILGHQWAATVPLMQLLPWISLLSIASVPVNPLFLAGQKQKYLTFITISHNLILYPSLYYMVSRHGLIGIPYALGFSLASTLPLRWFLGFKTLHAISKSS